MTKKRAARGPARNQRRYTAFNQIAYILLRKLFVTLRMEKQGLNQRRMHEWRVCPPRPLSGNVYIYIYVLVNIIIIYSYFNMHIIWFHFIALLRQFWNRSFPILNIMLLFSTSYMIDLYRQAPCQFRYIGFLYLVACYVFSAVDYIHLRSFSLCMHIWVHKKTMSVASGLSKYCKSTTEWRKGIGWFCHLK